MAFGEVFEYKIVGTIQDQIWNITGHIAQKVPGDGTAQEAANQVHGNLSRVLADVMSDETEINQTFVTQLTPEKMDPFANDQLGPRTGQVVSPALPSFVAGVVQERTGFASRSKRGRMYIPGIPESHVDGGRFNTAATTVYTSMFNTIITAFESAAVEFVLGVWSPTIFAATAQKDEAFTELTNMTLNPVLGTQRRRRIGSGN